MEYINLKTDSNGMTDIICPRCKHNPRVSPTTLYDIINHRGKITCSECTNVFPFAEDVLNKIDRAKIDRINTDWEIRNPIRVPRAKPNIQINI